MLPLDMHKKHQELQRQQQQLDPTLEQSILEGEAKLMRERRRQVVALMMNNPLTGLGGQQLQLSEEMITQKVEEMDEEELHQFLLAAKYGSEDQDGD